MTFPPGSHLRYALSRSSSRGVQIAGTLFLAIVIAIPASLILGQDERSLLSWLFGGVFAVVALLLVYSAIHQLLALRTPQTIVECDSAVFKRGTPVILYFRQPGPATVASLRADLVGEESWVIGKRRRSRSTRSLGTFNLFDSGPFTMTASQPWEQDVTVQVPDLPQPSDAKHDVQWRLVVTGRVRGRADFEHAFPVRVG